MPKEERNALSGEELNDRWLRRKNRVKVVRIVLQLALLALLIYLLCTYVFFPKRYQEEPYSPAGPSVTGTGGTLTASGGAAAEERGFIAVSYCGVTLLEGLDVNIVNQRDFADQLAALHASGYRTISQQDILDYYLHGKALPEKALFLIMEDGILRSSTLAQPTLEKYNYRATFCTYAQYLNDQTSKFATARDVKRLLGSSYWEIGSNGYRLSYINVFDRYGNYFGHLSTDEFVLINQFLRRDYNHYLMDFLRDEYRLRQETVEEMEDRIEYDYTEMKNAYLAELGMMPQMYVLMHSNTQAFGNDALVSDKNGEQLMQTFAMNFNRQGSCLNTRASSIYDLTRIQSQPYFSTNHLMMRIKDDTGDDVVFTVGDEAEAARWYLDMGAAEYRTNEIILTSEPYSEGRMTLKSDLVADLDMTVILEGNKVGVQSVYLRADRDLTGGVQVSLENNNLVVRDLFAGGTELFRLDLFEFDGGATKSRQEDECEGLRTLYETIIMLDEDPQRVEEAKQSLEKVNKKHPRSIQEGGEPYVPALDIAQRDSRTLRIRLVGERISVWLDGRAVAKNLPVSESRRGNVVLGSAVWRTEDHYSQSNIWDDVYDARFVDICIRDAQNESTVLYAYQRSAMEKIKYAIRNGWDALLGFFMSSF